MQHKKNNTLPDLLYKTIYLVDDLLDEKPDEWQQFTSKPGMLPRTIDEVVEASMPCGLLSHLAEHDSPVIEQLLKEYPSYIPLLNGMAYLCGQLSDAREEVKKAEKAHCPHSHIAKARVQLARADLHISVVARLVMDGCHGELNYDLDKLKTLLPKLIADDFVRITDVNEHGTYLSVQDATNSMGGGRSNVKGIAIVEMQTYMYNDLFDAFADLETERRTGTPTSNAFVNYCRVKYPDMDMQMLYDKAQEKFAGKSTIDSNDMHQLNFKLAMAAATYCSNIQSGLEDKIYLNSETRKQGRLQKEREESSGYVLG